MADTGPLVRYDVLGRPIKSTGDSFLDDALAEAREDREQRGIIRDWDWISDRVSELYEVAKGDPVALRYVHTGNVEDYATNVAVKILAEGGWTKDVDTAELVETTIRAGGWIQRNDLDEEVEEKVKAGCAVLSTKLTTDLNREKRRLHIQNVRRITTFTRSMGIMLVSLIIPFTHAIYPPAASTSASSRTSPTRFARPSCNGSRRKPRTRRIGPIEHSPRPRAHRCALRGALHADARPHLSVERVDALRRALPVLHHPRHRPGGRLAPPGRKD
jgi:hypothetical protein